MAINSEGRKIESDLVKGLGRYQEESATNVNFASVTVGGTGEVETIGLPVIWDDATSKFVLYSAQDIAAAKTANSSPLAGNRVLAVSVGSEFGRGFNRSDVDLSTDPTMTVLYRGDASITVAGITGWDAVTNKTEFQKELEAQDFTFVDNAAVVTPSYVV
jgi:hypothetical protein